jgi:hypothetical protein
VDNSGDHLCIAGFLNLHQDQGLKLIQYDKYIFLLQIKFIQLLDGKVVWE